jgi:transcriptional regulator with XRE-family HTH domain
MPAHAKSPTPGATAGAALGRWIRKTRIDQGITQRALADRSGLSRSYLCDIERGRGSQPSVVTLDKLSVALGATREELMRAAGMLDAAPEMRGNEDERRLLAIYRDLSEAGRETGLRFIRFLHAEEHQWVQAPMLTDLPVREGNGRDDGAGGAPAGPLLFDLPRNGNHR